MSDVLSDDERSRVEAARKLLPTGDRGQRRYPTVRDLLAIIDRLAPNEATA